MPAIWRISDSVESPAAPGLFIRWPFVTWQHCFLVPVGEGGGYAVGRIPEKLQAGVHWQVAIFRGKDFYSPVGALYPGVMTPEKSEIKPNALPGPSLVQSFGRYRDATHTPGRISENHGIVKDKG